MIIFLKLLAMTLFIVDPTVFLYEFLMLSGVYALIYAVDTCINMIEENLTEI